MPVAFGLDGVLEHLGTPHPCVTIHLLLTLGMVVIGLGSLELSVLLPIPIYSCWGGQTDYACDSEICDMKLIPDAREDYDYRLTNVCVVNPWEAYGITGCILVGVRVIIAILAGIGMDVFGRRRSVVAWMGLYFVVGFARTFSPNAETALFCITLEGACTQASTLGIILLATEGSTQKECVRSACLVLLGHAVGSAVGAPLIANYIHHRAYQQMARSLPSLVFVLFIIALPESARWAICRGHVHEAASMLKRSHSMSFDPTVQQKLMALYQEHKMSVRQYRCSGRALRESLQPLVRTWKLFAVYILFMLCGLAFGIGAYAIYLLDPLPFSSMEDRQLVDGIVEFLSLLLLGLTISRITVKFVLVILMATVALALLIVRSLYYSYYGGCGQQLFLSCFAQMSLVVACVWMGVGAIRLTPTHSRGAVLGSTFGMATLGSAIQYLNWDYFFHKQFAMNLDSKMLLWAAVTFSGGLVCLMLPNMPKSLPDTMTHMNFLDEEEKLDDQDEHENTQL